MSSSVRGPRFPSAEDQDLNNRVLRASHAVLCDPSLVVTHWGARPYSDGTVSRLLRDYSRGIGALAAKDLRLGSVAGGYPIIRELAAEARSAVLSLFKPGGEPFVFRSPWLLAGVWQGARAPLDRSRRTFLRPPDRD